MKCHICSLETATDRSINTFLSEIKCQRCGTYRISRSAITSLGRLDVPPHILSAALRYSSDRGTIALVDVRGGYGTETEIVQRFPAPKDPLDMVDLLLEGISLLPGGNVTSKSFDWELQKSLIGADRAAEVAAILMLGKEMGYLNHGSTSPSTVVILPEGWKRLREIKTQSVNSNKAFVALQFNEEMRGIYDRVYEPVLRMHGYEPAQTVHPLHNEKIDDFIIAEIRKSSLLIADFTGGRPNVYFEAGFALGLGVKVVWSIKEGEAPHFDTRQYNHVEWVDEDDLRNKLSARLDALPFRPA